MRAISGNNRILAIAIRSQRLGYAVLDGSNKLLDWGMVFYRRNGGKQVATTAKRISSLLELYAPSMIVVEQSELRQVRNVGGLRLLSKLLRREAARQSVKFHATKQLDVRKAFRSFDAKSKDDVAAALARMFPEVAYKLPHRRKVWESEHSIMPMFDAIAIGVSYWEHAGVSIRAPE
jgi:Holliday junction resolvasome RuvABC endonuclease subunit